MKAANTRVAVKSSIERQNRVDTVALHDGEVYCVPSGEVDGSEDDLTGALHVGRGDGEHFIDNTEQRIERRLNRVSPLNGDVSMEDLLQDLRVCYEPPSVEHAALEELLRVRLVGVRSTHEVHRDV